MDAQLHPAFASRLSNDKGKKISAADGGEVSVDEDIVATNRLRVRALEAEEQVREQADELAKLRNHIRKLTGEGQEKRLALEKTKVVTDELNDFSVDDLFK